MQIDAVALFEAENDRIAPYPDESVDHLIAIKIYPYPVTVIGSIAM
jgi:hypothetical protein